jgi:7-cyano-7-deazaguanine reductase
LICPENVDEIVIFKATVVDSPHFAMPSTRKRKNARPARRGLTLLGSGSTHYPGDPDQARLETFANTHPRRDYGVRFDCPEFTAICPITGQPDFGRITIEYVPNRKCIESKSLKLYLFSFRNHGAFHEEVVNRILDDVVAACRPRRAVVHGQFNPRGGISISVKAEFP